jgi:hypothetical protein
MEVDFLQLSVMWTRHGGKEKTSYDATAVTAVTDEGRGRERRSGFEISACEGAGCVKLRRLIPG